MVYICVLTVKPTPSTCVSQRIAQSTDDVRIYLQIGVLLHYEQDMYFDRMRIGTIMSSSNASESVEGVKQHSHTK